MLHHLLQWVQGDQTENLIRDVLKCSPPNESPSYWPAVSVQKIYMCVCVCVVCVDGWVGEWVQGEQTGNLIRDVLKCSTPNKSPSEWPAMSVQKMCIWDG